MQTLPSARLGRSPPPPALMVALILMALAALPAAAGSYLGVQRYTQREGLPQMTVTSLLEAPDGHLWIGTQEGLARFDGQKFDTFLHQPGEAGSLISSSVDALAVDVAHRLWIGSNESGVEIRGLSDASRIRIGTDQGLSHPTVKQLLVFGDGVLAGTARGFDRLRAQPPRAELLQASAEAVGLVAHRGGAYGVDRQCRLWRLDTLPALALPPAFGAEAACVGLLATDAGLWLASAEHGLVLVDDAGERLRHWRPDQLGVLDGRLSALGLRHSGAILLGFDSGGVARLDHAEDPAALPLSLNVLPGSRITHFLDQASGTLWIGTYASGLLRAGALSSALRDGLGDAAQRRSLPARSIYAIWQDDETSLLGIDRGLLRRDGGSSAWQPVAAIGPRSVRRILSHPEGGWWIGSLQGLWRLWPDGRAEAVAAELHPRISDLAYQAGRLWVATREGLFWLDQGKASQEGVPEALRQSFLTSLLVDPDQRLWIGSNASGLFALETDGALRHLHRDNGRLLHDSVWSLHARDGWIYAGSHGGGLQRLRLEDASGWQLSSRDGLSNNVVYRIEADARGRLWLSTNRGLNLVDPESRRVQVLGASDGLTNTEYNAGASFRDSKGQLYFGGTEGLDALDPAAVPDRANAATPRLSRLEVIGRDAGLRGAGDPDWNAIAIRPPLQLGWEERVISATLVAIDFSAPDAARLRYRLLGLDERWISPRGARSEVLLSGLPPGQYRLELEAAGRDGVFGTAEQVDIEILPPPWATPWARGGYVLLGFGLLATLVWHLRRRSQVRLARIAELNHLVEQRTADLQAANRQLQQSNARLDLAGRTDPLTQLSNRRDLQEWLQRHAARLEAQGQLFCLLDVDDFKAINDRHGHRVGDQVLVAFAARLRDLCREGDLVVRWGGEEFLLALPAARERDAAALLDRLLQDTAGPISTDHGEPLTVSCSIGVAPWPFAAPVATLGWEQSVALADRALYRAKAEGKQAWQLWLPGPALDARRLQDLLAGADPEQLGAEALRVCRGPQRGLHAPAR